MRRKKPKQTSTIVEKLVDCDNDIDISKRPIRKATKAALWSIVKVINYERKIQLYNEETMYDSGSFFVLSILEVPDVCDNITLTLHDGTSFIYHYDGMMVGSLQNQDYGVRKQGSRSGRYTSSLCSTARTLRTDDFITDTDVDRSTIVNLSHNSTRQNHITTTTTKRNETEINDTNVPTGRKHHQ